MERIKKILSANGSFGLNVPEAVGRLLGEFYTRQTINSGGVAIQGASSPGAKTVNTMTICIEGRLSQVAPANLPALTGYNLTANQFGLAIYAVDGGGNFSVVYGTPASSLNGVVIPPVAEMNAATNSAQVPCSMIILANGGSAFTGGTTALDSITTTYHNITGPFVASAKT